MKVSVHEYNGSAGSIDLVPETVEETALLARFTLKSKKEPIEITTYFYKSDVLTSISLHLNDRVGGLIHNGKKKG